MNRSWRETLPFSWCFKSKMPPNFTTSASWATTSTTPAVTGGVGASMAAAPKVGLTASPAPVPLESGPGQKAAAKPFCKSTTLCRCLKIPYRPNWSWKETKAYIFGKPSDKNFIFGPLGWGVVATVVITLAMIPQGVFAWLLADKFINMLRLLGFWKNFWKATAASTVFVILKELIGITQFGYTGFKGKYDLIDFLSRFPFMSLSGWQLKDSFIHPRNYSLPGLAKFLLTNVVSATFFCICAIAITNPDPDNPGAIELLENDIGVSLNFLKNIASVILFCLASGWSNGMGGPGLISMALRSYVRFLGPALMLLIDVTTKILSCCSQVQSTRLFSEYLNRSTQIRTARRELKRLHEAGEITGHLQFHSTELTDNLLSAMHPFVSAPYFSALDPEHIDNQTEALAFLDKFKNYTSYKVTASELLYAMLALFCKALIMGIFLATCYIGFSNFSIIAPLGALVFGNLLGLNGAYMGKEAIDHIAQNIFLSTFGSLSFVFLFYIMSIAIVAPFGSECADKLACRDLSIRVIDDETHKKARNRAAWIALRGGLPNGCQAIFSHQPWYVVVAALFASSLMEYPALYDLKVIAMTSDNHAHKVHLLLKTLEGATAFSVLEDFFNQEPQFKGITGVFLNAICHFFNWVWSLISEEPRRMNQARFKDGLVARGESCVGTFFQTFANATSHPSVKGGTARAPLLATPNRGTR